MTEILTLEKGRNFHVIMMSRSPGICQKSVKIFLILKKGHQGASYNDTNKSQKTQTLYEN